MFSNIIRHTFLLFSFLPPTFFIVIFQMRPSANISLAAEGCRNDLQLPKFFNPTIEIVPMSSTSCRRYVIDLKCPFPVFSQAEDMWLRVFLQWIPLWSRVHLFLQVITASFQWKTKIVNRFHCLQLRFLSYLIEFTDFILAFHGSFVHFFKIRFSINSIFFQVFHLYVLL